MIAAGQQIGGYTVLCQLGRGGMGEVYLAQHRRVARRAAIKVLIPELSQNEVVLDRFFNEARAASLIRHPGIVEILDCDVHDGQAYIVMEFLEGESFAGYLYRRGALGEDLPFFYGVATSVASAVGAAHTTNIIHRDLKPDNIFFHLSMPNDPGITVKILDFGIAKLAQQDGVSSRQTGTGAVLGTPAYMSPEQCLGAKRVDNRSDIYSLGCILYEALSGAPPFVREGFGELIVAHVSETPEPLVGRFAGVTADLDALVQRMLAKSADERPQKMEDVVTALRACARAGGVTLETPLRAKIAVERPPELDEISVTQPAAAPGPSAVATTPLGPGSRRRPDESGRAQPMAAEPSAGVARSRAASGPQQPLEGTRARGVSGPQQPLEAPRSRGMSGPHQPLDRAGASAAPSVVASAGSTRVLMDAVNDAPDQPRPSTTTFSSTASELMAQPAAPRGKGNQAKGGLARVAIAGGGALVVAGAIAFFALRPSDATKIPQTVTASKPVEPPAPVVPPKTDPKTDPVAPPAPKPVEPPPVAPRAVEETVRVDLQGAPAGTTAEVDGVEVALPIKLVRGPARHQLTLRAPGQAPRTIEVDGTHDRIVDMVAATAPAATAKKTANEGSRHAEGGTRTERPRAKDRGERGGADKAAGEKKPSGDREAITDI